MPKQLFTDKNISWLHFNGRVLEEAASEKVPLVERLKFLSIFSSNLDEFYRVKYPPLLVLQKIKPKRSKTISRIDQLIMGQQKRFGHILDQKIIPALKEQGVLFYNEEPIPRYLNKEIKVLFFNTIAGLLRPVFLDEVASFFAENNQLYQLVILKTKGGPERLAVVNIPSDVLPRLFSFMHQEKHCVVFLDDILKSNLKAVFPDKKIVGVFNIKITRDAELLLSDEYDEDIAAKIEKQLKKRDFGEATRMLYQPGIPEMHWPEILSKFNLHKSSLVKGGVHHGLSDLVQFPLKTGEFVYPVLHPHPYPLKDETLLEAIGKKDLLIHTPYHDYSTILRFFNEAAIHPEVEEIYTTLYRIASDSKIARALISAALNGKKVFVVVELKARFDEANNLNWSKKMKEAGIKIIHSSHNIKVHAKVALVSFRGPENRYFGLLATGNLNEGTARYYTDQILLTANMDLLSELKMLFDYLTKKQKPGKLEVPVFSHLLVSQFNLHKKFLQSMEREISFARKGLPAAITIKLNNLEEPKLIRMLYKASREGVEVRLLVRGICCLKPGVTGLSEGIRVKRIVDRYLEHSRIFLFENGGDQEIYLGSSDWMNRNIYRRIEVCFPIYDPALQKELKDLLQIQWMDNVKAVLIGADGENIPVKEDSEERVRAQMRLYDYFKIT